MCVVCEVCEVCVCVLLLVGCRCLVVFKLKIPDLHTVTDALNLHLSKCIKSKRAHSRRRGEMGEVASLLLQPTGWPA